VGGGKKYNNKCSTLHSKIAGKRLDFDQKGWKFFSGKRGHHSITRHI